MNRFRRTTERPRDTALLFRSLTGLADGLAPKELALRGSPAAIRPKTTWVPRFPRYVAGTQPEGRGMLNNAPDGNSCRAHADPAPSAILHSLCSLRLNRVTSTGAPRSQAGPASRATRAPGVHSDRRDRAGWLVADRRAWSDPCPSQPGARTRAPRPRATTPRRDRRPSHGRHAALPCGLARTPGLDASALAPSARLGHGTGSRA